jgi:hypothetical protein
MGTKLNSQTFETTVISSWCRSARVLERVNIYRTPLMQQTYSKSIYCCKTLQKLTVTQAVSQSTSPHPSLQLRCVLGYLTKLSAAHRTVRTMISNEVLMMCKGRWWTHLSCHFGIYLATLRKSSNQSRHTACRSIYEAREHSSATRSTSTNTAVANCSVRSCAGLVTEWLKHFSGWPHYFCWFLQLSGHSRSDPFQHTYHVTRT